MINYTSTRDEVLRCVIEMQQNLKLMPIFRSVCEIVISSLLALSCLSISLSVRPSVPPSAWNNSASTGGIFMKFNIRLFFEDLSRRFKFH